MGFGHLPQFVKHDVLAGRCLRCQRSFQYAGVVCTRDGVPGNQPITFVGELPYAKPCQAR